jgi:hypothetical protein
VSALLQLYPGAWRSRYGAEMEALLEDRRPGFRERVDLVRGAIDAWLHPVVPSRVPAGSALLGGGVWTVAAAAVVTQPTPADWPGYIADVLWLAVLGAAFLFVGTLGCALRASGRGGRPGTVAVLLTVAGYLLWIGALVTTATVGLDGPVLAAAQTLAVLGSAFVGVVLVRAGDVPIGLLILAGSAAMLVPWTMTWLAFGAAWNAVGWLLLIERSRSAGPGWRTS